jgi:hypothetical protein
MVLQNEAGSTVVQNPHWRMERRVSGIWDEQDTARKMQEGTMYRAPTREKRCGKMWKGEEKSRSLALLGMTMFWVGRQDAMAEILRAKEALRMTRGLN